MLNVTGSYNEFAARIVAMMMRVEGSHHHRIGPGKRCMTNRGSSGQSPYPRRKVSAFMPSKQQVEEDLKLSKKEPRRDVTYRFARRNGARWRCRQVLRNAAA